MTIEIKEKGTKAFYEEVVNIAHQYRGLIKRPERKLQNFFRIYRDMIFLMGALIGIYISNMLYDGLNTLPIILVILTTVAAGITGFTLRLLRKQVNSLISDDRFAAVILDENVVEINREDTQTIRLGWDNVAFVRSFKESTSFFANDASGIVISVTNKYKDQIMEYLKENNVGVQIINTENKR